jgi:hypothetical protein
MIGGRTRARTWDPLIKSHIIFFEYQWLSYKLIRFRTIRNQRVTKEMQTVLTTLFALQGRPLEGRTSNQAVMNEPHWRKKPVKPDKFDAD